MTDYPTTTLRMVECSPAYLADALRARIPVPDPVFDQLLPRELRAVSYSFWTPIDVALLAVDWLAEAGARRVLDIGSGAGKFCVIGALAGAFEMIGLEHRGRLVGAARELAASLGVADRATFVEGALGTVPLPSADAYYLYNPFGENLSGWGEGLDDEVELGVPRYQRDVARAEALLRDAPVGTLVLTYNGFGGTFPDSYETLRVDKALSNVLRLRRKTRADDARLNRSR